MDLEKEAGRIRDVLRNLSADNGLDVIDKALEEARALLPGLQEAGSSLHSALAVTITNTVNGVRTVAERQAGVETAKGNDRKVAI